MPHATARRVLLLGHRWLGLALGLVLALLGASGAVLSFQREIEAARHPALFRASGPADPAIGFAAVQRAAEAAGHQAGAIRPPDAAWPVWVVSPPRGARDARSVTLDPASGAVLGTWDARSGPVAFARDLHENLLLREQGGRQAVGWLGVLTLLFCGTGLWLWWPRRGGFGRALVTLRRRPALLLNLDLHRLAGAWLAVVLAVVALSGVAIVFPGWFRPLLGIAEPAPPPRPAPGAARGIPAG
ncbi:PepSY-associated TM helix domain-containing protein, partial [Paracraurococcus ruber]